MTNYTVIAAYRHVNFFDSLEMSVKARPRLEALEAGRVFASSELSQSGIEVFEVFVVTGEEDVNLRGEWIEEESHHEGCFAA